MQLLKAPRQTSYGTEYNAVLTDEFEQLIDQAKEKLDPFVKEKASFAIVYFSGKEGEFDSEHDTCNKKHCIESSKREIRARNGKGIQVKENHTDSYSDRDSVDRCCICGVPFNDSMTWVENELEYLEQEKPWDADFFKDNSFTIVAVFNSIPSADHRPSYYDTHNGEEILNQALKKLNDFYQRIYDLAKAIIDTDFSIEVKTEPLEKLNSYIIYSGPEGRSNIQQAIDSEVKKLMKNE